ncbi:amidase signature enzyme [Zopfia rhizophila CBS 207.26]|uniref:amidase n=1 Tax=Zopfia rhizophila CBS 207.26 TaxID=1314779 RepID=A0A6A6EJK0_9PEZI|nr:amidase signature enzyme [Zopfia rhizophila CBS 207.26]
MASLESWMRTRMSYRLRGSTRSRIAETIAKKAQGYQDATLIALDPPLLNIPADLALDSTLIPQQSLNSDQIVITETDSVELVLWLATGDVTAVEVTENLPPPLVNCVTELLLTTALERAAFLDGYLKTNGRPIGPLHGLPISVKEHIGMKGLSLNAAFISWHNRVTDANSHILDILDILLEAGAVLYVQTTQPQTLMHLETSSDFYGTTVNAINRNLTSGGSSGGEGAFIGMRGSCFGIGTDIGGSIRPPAANNRVYGLRPTSSQIRVVDWVPYKHDEAWSIISNLYFCNGRSEKAAAIETSGEPWRPLTRFVLKGDPNVKKLSIREVWDWTLKREEYRVEYLKLWGDVDVILCPVGLDVAPPLDYARYWGYTAQWNLLEHLALVAPVTKVDPLLDVKDESHKPRNGRDWYNYELDK